jgi:hypothetical protein
MTIDHLILITATVAILMAVGLIPRRKKRIKPMLKAKGLNPLSFEKKY